MGKKLFLLMVLFITVLEQVCSQQSLNGLLVTNSGKAVSYAVVSEILVSDESLVSSVLSDSIGRFRMARSSNESYLYVNHLGYISQKITLEKNISEIKIVLDEDTTIYLKEVEVLARRPIVKIMADRLVYDLDSNPLKNDNTLEALKFVPLINANSQGFSIIGKDNTIVYINGRKTNLNQDALMSYLRTLPAHEIKNIEVITTPNSSFSGEGSFGVVNIQLKNNEYDGLKGMLAGQIWKTYYVKERGSLNLNYQKNKIAANFNIGITNTSDWKSSMVEALYKQLEENTSTNTITDGNNLSYFANLSADYKLNESQIIGFIVNASLNNGNWAESGSSKFISSSALSLDSLLDIHYKSQKNNPEFAINTNYRFTFGNSRQHLLVDLDYLNNYNSQESDNKMNRLSESGDILYLHQNYKQVSPQRINVLSAKIEYGNSFASDLDMKLGVDMYYSRTKNDDKYEDWKSGESVIDALKSNNFEIKEWTPALFFHLDKKWNEKILTSIGSRLEYTSYKGMQHTSNEQFKNDYFKFLPALYFSYNPSLNHKINYNLSYRIARPSFKSLNPFAIYTSPISYSKGNPFLRPAKRLSQNLQYLLFNSYYFTVSYDEVRDLINGIQVVRENNLVESKPINIGKQQKICLLFDTNFKYWNKNATLSLNLSYNWVKAQGSAENINLNYTSDYLNVYLSNYYDISKKQKISFDFGANYVTKQRFSNLSSPAYLDINAQLRKQIKKCQISLYCNLSTYLYDNMWTQKSKLIYETDELLKTTVQWGEGISLGFRISYGFGNTKVKEFRQRKTSNSDVKSRVN